MSQATRRGAVEEMPPPLRAEVRLLGARLGQVLGEAEGPERRADVERLRHATIELRQTRGPRAEELLAGVVAMVDGFDLGRAESVARAFTVYFQLVNLAEERHRVRTLRARSQAQASVPESLAVTVAELQAAQGEAALRGHLEKLEIRPVLTANPAVDHEVTRATLEVQAEHILLGLEAATRRVGRSLTVSQDSTPPSAELLASLSEDEAGLGRRAAEIRQRSPGEPHRRKLLHAAERLRATRLREAAAYPEVDAYLADLALVQDSLVRAEAPRLAYGELQHLVWQAQTFGFHLASLEVRQHSLVLQAALDELAAGQPLSEESRQVLETFRVMAELQARWGLEACRRYVVSFTRRPDDVLAVLTLARQAVPDGTLQVDPVPLCESRSDLEKATGGLDGRLDLPDWRQWIQRLGP